MKKYLLVSKQFKLVFLTVNSLFFTIFTFSQSNITIKEVYDKELSVINSSVFFKNKEQTILLIAPNCCMDCIKYFEGKNLIDKYLIVINDLSLMEIKTLSNQFKINKKKVYYILRKDLISENFEIKNLYIIKHKNNDLEIYDYNKISVLRQKLWIELISEFPRK